MFVLQDCSICFEDYDAERQPHSIPCGHVFCQPCLESLASTSPQCPNCRASYEPASIRKVICNLQDQTSSGTGSAAQESEAETLMWQAIQSATESPQDLEQRKSIIQNNAEDALLAAGMNKNVLTSLAMMRLLVQVEENNRSLKDKLDTSWAVEESLRDQIAHLEEKLSFMGANKCPSSEHFKLLLQEVHKLQSVAQLINKNTSDVAQRLSAKPEPPAPQARPAEVPGREAQTPILPTAPVSERTPTPRNPPSRPGILRKPPPQDTNNSMANSPVDSPTTSRISLGVGNPPRQDPSGPTHHRYPSTPTPSRQLMSPPMTPATLTEPLDGPPLFGHTAHLNRWKSAGPPPYSAGPGGPSTEQAPHAQNLPLSRHLSMTPAPTPNQTQMAHLSMPTPSILNTTNPSFVHPRPAPTPTPTQPSSSNSINKLPLPATPIPAPTPNPQSRPRTLIATFEYVSNSSTELSLRNGQKLYMLPESDPNKDWIWCRDENGTTGYAPKSYVKVDNP
ncbi:unnamed protein product [Rhizoctonia solani]|uniref:SH3 domain-containing protein n=1 Tax=Rhizoctonia solani TaxID=456999 RepID=A0A8H3DU34_9AGAM|nr:unnamed protein product [Rhizoctonia solani]